MASEGLAYCSCDEFSYVSIISKKNYSTCRISRHEPEPSGPMNKKGINEAWRLPGMDRQAMVLVLLGLSTVIMTLLTLLGKYSLFRHLDATPNQNERLLNTAQAWVDFGFWNMGGFMNFQYGQEGFEASQLIFYKSHVPLYVIPHYLGLLLAGETGFWAVVGSIPVISAFVIALSLGSIAFHSISSMQGPTSSHADHDGQNNRDSLAWIGAAIAFSLAFSSEPVWIIAWRVFDGTFSMLLLIVGIAICMASQARRWWDLTGTSFLLLAAFSCTRTGLLLAPVLALTKVLNHRSSHASLVGADCTPFRWPVIFTTFILAAFHPVRAIISEKFFGFSLSGSGPLYRMGYTHIVEEAGQGNIDYHTPLGAFTFLWRQSDKVINELPSWANHYHFIVWTIAIIIFALICSRKKSFPMKPYLEVLLLFPLAWALIFNQSAAEHPQLIAILWLPAYALGLSFGLTRLYHFIANRWRKNSALWWTSALLYCLYLWQIQYFLRAYPQLISE